MSSSQLERLESLLQAKAAANEPEFKLALTRLAAEAKGRMTKDSPTSVEFFSATLRALSKIRGTAHADLRLQCMHDSSIFLYGNGRSAAAFEAVRMLDDLAKRTGKKRWTRRAASFEGILHGDLGNVANAAMCYSKAITISREIGDFAGECAALLNLGGALNYGGLFREAIPCFHKAIEFAQMPELAEAPVREPGLPPRELQLHALTNLAQSHLYLGELERGLAVITRCLSMCVEPFDVHTATSRGIRELTYVRLALRLRKLDDARKHTELCEFYGNSCGRRARFHAVLARGLYEVYGGHTGAGVAILEAALDSYGDVPSLRMDALEALVEAHDQAGQPDRALECLQTLLGHIREVRKASLETLLSLPHPDPAGSFSNASDDLHAFTSKEFELRARVAEHEVVNGRIEMLERLAVTADLKDDSSGEHGYRVGKLAALVAEGLGWNREACHAIDLTARLHDIGKIGMPDRILLSSKELRQAELHFISTHTVIGAELLAKGNCPELKMAEEIARHHHEWWNGSGYPSKLAGKGIPIHARIVALADVFDALTHGRPYAEPWSIDRAIEEIRGRRGTQFDPDLADRFLTLVQRLRAEHQDLDAFLGTASRHSTFLQAREKIRVVLAEERRNDAMSADTGSGTVH
jgi:putative two-component system response regulator